MYDDNNEIFTSDDAVVLLSALLGNRPIKVFTGNELAINTNDVIIYKTDKMYLYNVIKDGNLTQIPDDDKLVLIDLSLESLKKLFAAGSTYTLPLWEYKGFNDYAKNIRGWKKMLIVRHDFATVYTLEELKKINKLSVANSHPTVYPKEGSKEAPMWIFEDAINFNQTSAHLYISRI